VFGVWNADKSKNGTGGSAANPRQAVISMTDRRAFLGMMATGVSVAGARASAAAPSERVRLGVIGLRSRGTDLVKMFASNPGCEVVALCDIDDASFAKPQKAMAALEAKAPRTEKDFRRLLDDKSIDAVAIATPDHWHALLAVMACQAGKDVYVEKPVSHNVVEGRRMVQAARKYDRVVQAGTQRRSTKYVAEAIGHVHSGAIGKVGMARAWIHQKRSPIGHGKPGQLPAGVDYAMWQGPAQDRPFYPNRFHYNWHWFWNWGTGELGNNGIHGVDVARWGLGVDAPLTVSSGGGKFMFDDDQEVPDTQIATWEFPGSCIVWEHRMWSNHPEEGSGFGIAFYGDKGTLVIGEKTWSADGVALKPLEPSPDGQKAHVQNFLDCIKSRNTPTAEIETGFLSTRLCHLGNIAYRVGKKLTFDAANECFHDPEADALLSRHYGSRFEMPSVV
jgi:predicted dehydrogenase